MLSIAAFTLAWTHSIEKVEWQERLADHAARLELAQARVKGSGAGMEPPSDARLVNGWFQWQPKRPPMPEVVLGNSGAAANGGCAATDNAVRCRRFSASGSAPMSRP